MNVEIKESRDTRFSPPRVRWVIRIDGEWVLGGWPCRGAIREFQTREAAERFVANQKVKS